MRARRRAAEPSLPERLAEDLAELFASERAAFLTWQDRRDESERPRWFRALAGPEDATGAAPWRLRFQCWIPGWMQERGVRAILPARLQVDDCQPGAWASTTVATGSFAELQRGLAPAARVAARLIQELWGATAADEVWLRELADQEPTSATP